LEPDLQQFRAQAPIENMPHLQTDCGMCFASKFDALPDELAHFVDNALVHNRLPQQASAK
jgi:hypothetical protein